MGLLKSKEEKELEKEQKDLENFTFTWSYWSIVRKG